MRLVTRIAAAAVAGYLAAALLVKAAPTCTPEDRSAAIGGMLLAGCPEVTHAR